MVLYVPDQNSRCPMTSGAYVRC